MCRRGDKEQSIACLSWSDGDLGAGSSTAAPPLSRATSLVVKPDDY